MLDDSSVELEFNAVDNDGNSALYLAVVSGELETVKLVLKMLQKTCSLDEIHRTNNAGICPLLAAFHRADKNCARYLISQGDAPVSSVIKYLKELAEDSTDPMDSHPFYVFSAKSHDLGVNLLSCNTNMPTKKDVLRFLFAKDDTSSPIHSKKTKTGTKLSGLRSRNTSDVVPDFSHRKTPIALKYRESKDAVNMDKSEAGSNPCFKPRVSITISEDSQFYSSRESVLQLYDVYKEQLTDSYREGLPVRRYKTPSPPPPGRKESKARPNHFNQQHGNEMKGILSPKRGSLSSSSGSLPSVHESSLDKQIRMKYARSNRAVSMQATKLPPIPGNLRKRETVPAISVENVS